MSPAVTDGDLPGEGVPAGAAWRPADNTANGPQARGSGAANGKRLPAYPNCGISGQARRLGAVEKPLDRVGSSKKDFLAFPARVKDAMGAAPAIAQFGGKHPAAKPWKGEGPGVLEVVEDHSGDTYRAVYTVRFREVVYVLHAFHKKSPSGIRTATTDVELVHRRLRIARTDHEARYGKPKLQP